MTNVHARDAKLSVWDSVSSVRSKPDRYTQTESWTQESREKDWFPKKMMGFIEHNAFLKIPPAPIKLIGAKHLAYFLNYTVELEHLVVNRAIEKLVHRDSILKLPAHMITTALEIYTDEGYHALFSHNLALEVQKFNKITPYKAQPKRISLLKKIVRKAPKKTASSAGLLLDLFLKP